MFAVGMVIGAVRPYRDGARRAGSVDSRCTARRNVQGELGACAGSLGSSMPDCRDSGVSDLCQLARNPRHLEKRYAGERRHSARTGIAVLRRGDCCGGEDDFW